MAASEATGKYKSAMSKSKDPSGLLISVIRTLSTSDDVEDRENEKGRLEEAYEKCDRDLDELIVQHYAELTTAIRTYQSITERITNSRNKIKQVKENLLSCKMLLHCKRDELRKLWIEGIEHKHVLNLLDEIENIKQVPQKLQQHMASKHYLTATDMLVSAVDSLEGPLLQVEGLSDLRLELHSKKMNMHLVLIDELHRHLYIKSTNRVGQQSKEKGRISSLVKDVSPGSLLDVTTPRKFLDSSQFGTPGSASGKDVSLMEIKEDLESDPEENSSVFMGILIKALAKLKKIPESVKAIQDRLEQELKQIVKRSTTQVADSGYQKGENLAQENQPRLLLELLELLFDKFNAVAAAHAIVLGHLQQAVASPSSQYDGDIKLYDMADVWVKIQDVLQAPRNCEQQLEEAQRDLSDQQPRVQLAFFSLVSKGFNIWGEPQNTPGRWFSKVGSSGEGRGSSFDSQCMRMLSLPPRSSFTSVPCPSTLTKSTSIVGRAVSPVSAYPPPNLSFIP
ncbi:hypothetical protein JRQ81_015529 [Phrynocephalus forsythii]|uniref:Exocyst complex component Sec8 n=1 Tax=Phrynocephalus forsythii TaxID=171643 RepID=A0A9Q0XV02_9SAUR|nr:hypothetical protein JRQ81_015529 [Phrynocephalus forsythii]